MLEAITAQLARWVQSLLRAAAGASTNEQLVQMRQQAFDDYAKAKRLRGE